MGFGQGALVAEKRIAAFTPPSVRCHDWRGDDMKSPLLRKS